MSAVLTRARSGGGMPAVGLNFALIVALTTDLRRKVSLLGVGAFILLSLADLALTKLLVEQSGFMIYEANPLAELILKSHGWAGLTLFKLGAVLLISTIICYIGYFRPNTAKRLLTFACLIMSVVVAYSTFLVSYFV